MTLSQKQKNSVRLRRKRLLLRLFLALGLGVFLVGALWITHTYPFKKKVAPIPIHTADSSTKGEPLTTAPQSSSQSQNSSSTDNKSQTNGGSTSTPTVTLKITDGNFVSNHHAKLNDAEQSSCVVNAASSCQIIFTNGSVVKTLAAQNTDIGGGVYWNSWTPSSIGLTPGSWHVQAKATAGSQTATADDAITLDISS
jgi:cytoskeletal protein RodZ